MGPRARLDRCGKSRLHRDFFSDVHKIYFTAFLYIVVFHNLYICYTILLLLLGYVVMLLSKMYYKSILISFCSIYLSQDPIPFSMTKYFAISDIQAIFPTNYLHTFLLYPRERFNIYIYIYIYSYGGAAQRGPWPPHS